MEQLKVLGEKTQGDEHKVGYYDYILKFSHSCQHWNRFPRKTTKSSSPDLFKTQLDTTEQFDPVGSAFSRGWIRWLPGAPANLNYSIIKQQFFRNTTTATDVRKKEYQQKAVPIFMGSAPGSNNKHLSCWEHFQHSPPYFCISSKRTDIILPMRKTSS